VNIMREISPAKSCRRRPGARATRNRKLRLEQLESRAMMAESVVPSVETVAASGGEDDAAIWIHPTDTAQSRIIGAVKTGSGALRVFDLNGQPVQIVNASGINNIDLRYNFPLAGERVALLAGSNRSNNSISLYKIDSQTGMLESIAARAISTGMSIYGCAMYVSPTSGKYYVFVSSESGQVQQWELFDNGAGLVDAVQVRSFTVGSRSEGLVADDALSHLYVGEENAGIWKYSAEPGGGSARTLVDGTGAGGHLDADVEGLAIYYANGGYGYLLASSQGSNEFIVYERDGNNSFIGSFTLVAGGGIDAVTDTDGIDVTNFALGSQFPLGLFVAQDNDDNFKLVRWDTIDAALGGVLIADSSWDPRLVGRRPQQPALPGDYNSSGHVDAADYVVWRKALGQTVAPFRRSDGNGDGRVDAADYGVWRADFDRSLPAAASSAAAPFMAELPGTKADIGWPQPIAKPAPLSRGLRWTSLETGDSNRERQALRLMAIGGPDERAADTRSSAIDQHGPSDARAEVTDAAFESDLLMISMPIAGEL
jgi:3-phytase